MIVMEFNRLVFLVVYVSALTTATGAEPCPANQPPNGTCNISTEANCTDGHICYKDACCPNCLTRLQQADTRTLGVFLPQCDPRGAFLSEQCHYSAGQCWCMTEVGEEIPNTRVASSVTVRGRRNCEEERAKYNQSATEQPHSKIEGQQPMLETINETTTPQPEAPGTALNPSEERPGACPLVNPGQRGPCLTRCMRDTDCPIAGFKCCDNGCGRECKPAVITETASGEEKKPGKCKSGSPSPVLRAGSNGTCVSDSECPSDEKCCANAVGQMFCTSDLVNDTSPAASDAAVVNITDLVNDTCGPNTVVSPCFNPCPIGCDHLAEPSCIPTNCNTGCECAPGFVRSHANDTSSPCVELIACSSVNVTVPTSPSKMCNDSNAIWIDCGTACEETCQFKPARCTKQCVPGCFCRRDFVKESNDTDAQCVLRNQCHRSELMSPPLQQCQDPNSVWSNCGNSCVETCRSGFPDFCKTLPCASGCFCKPGYVKDVDDPRAKCVPRSECNLPVIRPDTAVQLQGQCPDSNSVFLNCGTACEETCQYRPTVCTKQCVQGCFCKPGFVKQSSSAGAVCVARDRCTQHLLSEQEPRTPSQQPRCQDPNAVFQLCGSACLETCDYRPTVCIMPCISGCFCREGFVKENGLPTARCVPKSQCGQLSPPGSQRRRCPDPNSSWSICGTACQPTCQQPNPMCALQCVTGCFCNEGYVKESDMRNARCVPMSMCPTIQTCPDPNSTWQECGSACEETCEFRPTLCTLQCVSGCFCNDGFVKHTKTPDARCVPRSACFAQQDPTRAKPGACPSFYTNPYFGQPSRQDECGSDNDCRSALKCCNSQTGFVCMVPAGSEKKQQCGNNQEYSPCPPPATCVLTCDNYKSPPPECSVLECRAPGCQCRAGYVVNTRADGRECMPPHLCVPTNSG